MRFLNSLARTNRYLPGLAACALGTALLSLAASVIYARPPGSSDPVVYAVLPQPDYDIRIEDLDSSHDGLLVRGAIVDGQLVGIEQLVGRADADTVVISNPAVATLLPMLHGWVDEDGFLYDDTNPPDLLHNGPMAIYAPTRKSPATLKFYYGGYNRVGDRQMHLLEAIADISGPGDPDGTGFPNGVAPGQVYKITLRDWYVTHDTKSGKDAYQGRVVDSDGIPIGDTVIELLRVQ